jgi:26S proteasome regulatory subunit T5
VPDESTSEQGAAQNTSTSTAPNSKCAVIKTSSRQTVFLPMIGLVPADKLKPSDLIGVNKDSYLVLDTLPAGQFWVSILKASNAIEKLTIGG